MPRKNLAITAEGESHRLRAAGQQAFVEQTAKAARMLATIAFGLTRKTTEGLEIFFGMGTPSTECESAAPAATGAGASLPWIKNV